MKQPLLTIAQKSVIKAVSIEPNLRGFYLSGGTALSAYYFKHRISDDLDFFCFDNPDATYLHAFADQLKQHVKVKTLRTQRLYDRNLFFFGLKGEELKIEFSKYPFIRLGKPMRKDGILIDSLRDIAANKLMALLDRFDPKDFVDLYFLLQKFPLSRIHRDAEKKFGTQIDILYLGGELTKVRRIVSLPKMLIPIEIEFLKDFFIKLAKTLGKRILA